MGLKQKHRIGIIGCGLIGQKRAAAIKKPNEIIAFADPNKQRAQELAKSYDAQYFDNIDELIDGSMIDVVIVATPHSDLAKVSQRAVEAGKHVLVEKPAAVSTIEIDELIRAQEKKEVKVQVGYNHRFHRGVLKATELIAQKEIGDLMFVRGRYGHGGRIGYEREWRANKKISGGGELIDQGTHLIDLSQMLLGNFTTVYGKTQTYFWEMDVDDNAFLCLQTGSSKTAFLQASCTEWKNLFAFEIYGERGKILIEGLGGSYGTETTTLYKMLPEMGPPETIAWSYPMEDNSWEIELESFFDAIDRSEEVQCGLAEARHVLEVVTKVYEENA